MCQSSTNMQQPPFNQAHENMDQSQQYHYPQSQQQPAQHSQQQHPQQQHSQQHPQQQQQHPQQQDVQHQNQYYYPQQFQVKQEPADYYSPVPPPNGFVNSMFSNDLPMNGLPPHNGMHMNGMYNGVNPMNNGYPRNGFHIKQEPMYCNNPSQMLNPAGQLHDPSIALASTTPTTTTKKKGKSKKVKQETLTDAFPVKKRRKVDRFNGMPEEEVAKRVLPDHLKLGLDIMIIGINPGLFAAYKGHHYAGPGNHFWKCLYLSGLIPEPMTAMDDYKLLDFGIGFTNIVERTSRGSADLSKKEIKEGAKILLEKVKQFKPKIAVFNGKGIYEVFNGSKNFEIGRQPEPMEGTDTVIYVMPSSSARCSQFPRAQDKVKFYLKLKELREELLGTQKSITNTSTDEQKSPKTQEEPTTVSKDGEEVTAVKEEEPAKELGTKVAEESSAADTKPVIKSEPKDNLESGCDTAIDIKLEKNVDGTIQASDLHFLKNDKYVNNSGPAPQNGHTEEPVKVKQEPKENGDVEARCTVSDGTENSPQPCSLSQRMLQTASWVQSLPSLPMENRFEDQIPNINNPQRSQYFQGPHSAMSYYSPHAAPQPLNDHARMNQHMTSTTWMGNQQMMFSPHPMALPGGHPSMMTSIPSPFTQSMHAHSNSITSSNVNIASVETSQHKTSSR